MSLDIFLEHGRRVDLYGNFIHDGDVYMVDLFKQCVVHHDYLIEYLTTEYQDFFCMLIMDDKDLLEYIKQTYECEVYTR